MKSVATLKVRHHKTKFLILVLMLSSLRYIGVLNQCKISYIIFEHMSVKSLIKNQNFLNRKFSEASLGACRFFSLALIATAIIPFDSAQKTPEILSISGL